MEEKISQIKAIIEKMKTENANEFHGVVLAVGINHKTKTEIKVSIQNTSASFLALVAKSINTRKQIIEN